MGKPCPGLIFARTVKELWLETIKPQRLQERHSISTIARPTAHNCKAHSEPCKFARLAQFIQAINRRSFYYLDPPPPFHLLVLGPVC